MEKCFIRTTYIHSYVIKCTSCQLYYILCYPRSKGLDMGINKFSSCGGLPLALSILGIWSRVTALLRRVVHALKR